MALLSRSASLIALAAAAAGLVAAAPTPDAPAAALSIDDLRCERNGNRSLWCEADVSGATGPVTYTWNPTPYFGQSVAWIPCSYYSFMDQHVTLTVSDGSTTATASNVFDCYDGE